MFNPHYDSCVKLFKANSDTHIGKWLNVERVFKSQGKYGITGLATYNEDPTIKFVFKISKYNDNNTQHEHNIMCALGDMRTFCPHFCNSIGLVKCAIGSLSKKLKSFDEPTGNIDFKTDILLCEFLGRMDMELFIKDLGHSDFEVLSVLKQLILGLSMAQKSHKLTHYDLHLKNVMIGNCGKDDVFVYVIDENNQFCVPTHGHFPIIIDYGFSYVENEVSPMLLASMEHANYGYTSCDFDEIADIKRVLYNVCTSVRKYRNSPSITAEFDKLEQIVKNIFVCKRSDIYSGLTKYKDCDAYQNVIDVVKPFPIESTIFGKHIITCIDLIQQLICLPVCDMHVNKIDLIRAHVCVDAEWAKIERVFSKKESAKMIGVFKAMIDAAKEVKNDYVSDIDSSRGKAICSFKKSFYTQTAEVCKFFNPKDVNFDILLCSLFIYSTYIETEFFRVSDRIKKMRQKKRAKMMISQPEQIYGALEANFKDPFKFKEGVTVHIFDRVKKEKAVYTPTQNQCDDINKVHNLSKGTFIYDSF
jgi:hypothetical protein